MASSDPNLEWLGYLQPTGLVVAPAVLARYGLVPKEQTRTDSEALVEHIAEERSSSALADPWAFFRDILGWPASEIAGAPGGPKLPETLSVWLPEAETMLAPTWAVKEPDGGFQLLVRLENAGIAPDARGALSGWEASAAQRHERLLRETNVPTGLLLTDNELRVIYAPRGETSGWLAFPLRSLGSVAGRPMLAGLKLLLSSFRLFNDAPERRLPGLLKASRDAQTEVSARLAVQVLGALYELLRGLHGADRARIESLAAREPAQLYEGLLSVLLRLVFLLYAEDRDLLPSRNDAQARALYESGYGVRSLHARLTADAARYPDTMEERHGAWARLLALFRLIEKGDASGWIKGRGGRLFDPASFPFLEGRDAESDAPAPAPIADQAILRVLDGLLVLDGEKLSYRTLDVEQIGSVYETVMGFTVVTLPAPALAIKAGKSNHVPVFVDLAHLARLAGEKRARFLKEHANRSQLPTKVASALAAAGDEAGVAAALRPIVDERGSPGGTPAAPGTPLLQPTDERRRTGSHYTPRTLTEPIVRHALAPAFARFGEAARPEDVLALKVCDPAMGSGAFLVEACRQIAARLARTWARHPGTRPMIPADENEDLLARRLVAQRCLYGVDRNPMAVVLARLSLWLATLAREHEFTFLNHALKAGDSVAGLAKGQIAALNWDLSKGGPSLFSGLIRDQVQAAIAARRDIQEAPDDITRAMQETREHEIEQKLVPLRTIGDAVIASFFGAEKPKDREKLRVALEMAAGGANAAFWPKAEARAAELGGLTPPLRPFHWEIEFPEVFARENPGFDAVVGNPPFAGKNTIAAEHGPLYGVWLQALHQGAHGNSDYVAHFFRRAFALIRQGGVFGLIATNTIGQGDTRETGLAPILNAGGAIVRATRRLVWPGQAAVVVSIVHVAKGAAPSPVLDDRRVRRISAYLVEGERDDAPAPLPENRDKAFIGSYVLGMGFTFDDVAAAKGTASSLADMQRLIAKNPRNGERIFPYIGGEEVNNDPAQRHRRYVIDFGDMSEAEARSGWPDLMAIVEARVKPVRLRQASIVNPERWWMHARPGTRLFSAIAGLDRVLVVCRHAPQFSVAALPPGCVYAESLVVFPFAAYAPFAVLQSRVHELWARFFASTLEDRLRYTPTDCFETFPFPPSFETDTALGAAGAAYHAHRAAMMIATKLGLTKTYNRFHDPSDTRADIVRLRELHAAMDKAALAAYGWDDLVPRAEFLTEETEPDPKYQNRYFWPAALREEVLSPLLALNAERTVPAPAQPRLPAQPRRLDVTGAELVQGAK